MISYLATPYSHPDPEVRERRYELACRAAAAMLKRGDVVFCPIAHTHRIGQILGREVDHDFWIKVDLAILDRCDELVVMMLDGWKESAGVQAEIGHARKTGKPIRHLFPEDLGAR